MENEDGMNNLVEAIKMSFQDALSHRGWGPLFGVCRWHAQSRRATDPRPYIGYVLVSRKAGTGGRCHCRRGRGGRWRGRRRPVGGALEEGRIDSTKGEATENTCTTRFLLLDHRWGGGRPLRCCCSASTTGPSRGSTTLMGGVANFYLLALFIFEDRGSPKSGRAPVRERGTGFRGRAHKLGKERRAGRRRGSEVGRIACIGSLNRLGGGRGAIR
jgi:hypothetical protein